MGSPQERVPDCRKCLFLKSLVGAGLPRATIDALCARMSLNRVRRRQILFLEGNRAAHLYAVRRGQVKLVKIDAHGRDHLTAILEAGDLFGLEAAFENEYASGAEALTDCELCLLSAPDLRDLVTTMPQLGLDLTRYLHAQLVRARERLVSLQFPRACTRVAGFLLHHLPADGEPTVSHNLTLRELGGALGLSPETVCRALGVLKAKGVIEAADGHFRIRDLEALRVRAHAV